MTGPLTCTLCCVKSVLGLREIRVVHLKHFSPHNAPPVGVDHFTLSTIWLLNSVPIISQLQYTSNWLLQSPFQQHTNSLSPTPNLNSASLRDETLKPIDTRCSESSNTAVSADFRCRSASANLRCAPCGRAYVAARHHLGTIGYPKIPWFELIFPLKLP